LFVSHFSGETFTFDRKNKKVQFSASKNINFSHKTV
jgi:hypothetical protein